MSQNQKRSPKIRDFFFKVSSCQVIPGSFYVIWKDLFLLIPIENSNKKKSPVGSLSNHVPLRSKDHVRTRISRMDEIHDLRWMNGFSKWSKSKHLWTLDIWSTRISLLSFLDIFVSITFEELMNSEDKPEIPHHLASLHFLFPTAKYKSEIPVFRKHGMLKSKFQVYRLP